MPTLEARAKINLFLRVLGRRADGFHEIESIFHTVDLADRIEVDDADDLVVEMDEASEVRLDIPPEENIVYRAAQLLRRTSEVPHGARIRILKSIPFGAGLGGGSVDAAAVLVALERTWGLSLSDESLRDVAAEVGSDVPYCLTGGPALVTGRGENVSPVPAPETLWCVLGISSDPLSTAEVYGLWQADDDGAATSHQLAMALGAGDVQGVAAALHNDLEPVAFRLRPSLAQGKKRMLEAGALGAVMSGSGPTILGLASDPDHALGIAEKVKRYFDRIETASTCGRSVLCLDDK